jgi:hypothetical protein
LNDPVYLINLFEFRLQMTRSRLFALTTSLVTLALAVAPRAHDIPSDVRIFMFIKPDEGRLRVPLRVPLASIVETAWPERGPGLLDLSRAEPLMRDGALSRVADDLEILEAGRRLDAPRIAAIKASLPSDRSFESYDSAVQHITGPPLPDDTEFVISQGYLDVLFEYPIQSHRSKFAIRPNFLRLGVTVQTVVTFLPPDEAPRVFSLHNDPGLVYLEPTFVQVARMFARDGFWHILSGADHLLFLFVLVIPFVPGSLTLRGLGSLVAIATSFTVAHTVALVASAYDMTPGALWFPALVNTLIALSILYVALDNLIAPSLRRRWMVAFGFGLAHGFGFALELRDSLQFSGNHFLTSLISFNLGLEAGLLGALALIVPAVALFFRHVVEERMGAVILSLIVAHTGWHWTVARYYDLRRYQFQLPAFDAAFFVIVIRWLMVVVVLAGLAWLIFGVFGNKREFGTERN